MNPTDRIQTPMTDPTLCANAAGSSLIFWLIGAGWQQGDLVMDPKFLIRPVQYGFITMGLLHGRL